MQQTLVASASTAQIIAEWLAHTKKNAIQIIFRTLHRHHDMHADTLVVDGTELAHIDLGIVNNSKIMNNDLNL